MKEIIILVITLSGTILTALLVHIIKEKREEKRERARVRALANARARANEVSRRTPYRIDSSISHKPVCTGYSQPRIPSALENADFMTFRNCPDCHSENTFTNQYIFKLGPHDYVCRRCGCKFTS